MITLEPPRSMVDGAGQVAEAEAWSELGLSRTGLSRFLRAAQMAVGLHGEVAVLLADDRMLRRLNREYRGKNKATDVLSFPAAADFGGEHAGDLAISLETAQRQAMEHGHSLRDEVRVLLLHGVLHLAGMDHEADGGEMAAREAALRVRLRLPSGLIARAGAATARARVRVRANANANAKAKAKANTGVLRCAQDDGVKQAKAKAKANAIAIAALRCDEQKGEGEGRVRCDGGRTRVGAR